MLSYDVLVIGAGPAGGATALAAARKGARVLCIERRRRVGVPVQCAEHIPALLIGQMSLGRDFVVQPTRGITFFLPGEPEWEMAMPGFVINRDQFDRCIIEAAVAAGAQLMTATRAVRRIGDDSVLLQQKKGPPFTVKAEVIVGADGPRSTVGRWVSSVNRQVMRAVQMTLPLTAAMDHTEIYFDRDYYGGYGWLFPKNDVANVGLGMKARQENRQHLQTKLAALVDHLAADGKIKNRPIKTTGGFIPVGPVRPVVYGNVVLVGDAAGQTHPITGAGIYSAVTCGQKAGEWAAAAVNERDMGLLGQYDIEWRDLFEDALNRGYRHRMNMEDGWEERFPDIIKSSWAAYGAHHG